jgi:hypothetical protein
MQHSVACVRQAPQGMAVRVQLGGDRNDRTNPQARTAVTGRRCVRCQDVAPTLVASDASMMRQSNAKAQRRGQMPPPASRDADPFSRVGKPLPASFMNGMPPHIAQLVAGHADINTTMGYTAVYPRGSHQRRPRIPHPPLHAMAQPGIPPTDEEWHDFLGHLARRKVALGGWGRAWGTVCIDEHSTSGVRSCGLTGLSGPGWPACAPTCWPASTKPSAKAGSARPRA